jgi:hypothetical protein
MTEQWFLDLDGTRSGPYQTNEILGLIAEGEVLPHHRIARGLKDPVWKTILDWRLEHARKSPSPTNSEVPSTPKKEAPAPSEATPPLETKKPVPPPIPEIPTPRSEFAKEVESIEKTLAALPPETGKRDPMAEMFDLLQNTKNKREAKQIQNAQQASQEAATAASNSGSGPNLGRLIAICVGVALIGLGLGQWLQYSSRTVEPKSTPPAPQETKPEVKKEVIDRSTDKVTIKTIVDKKPEPPKLPTPFPKYSTHTAPARPQAHEPDTREEKKQSEKEIEELRDLKKELQELKALKEQLRDAPLNDDAFDTELPPYNSEAAPSPHGTPLDGQPAGGNRSPNDDQSTP